MSERGGHDVGAPADEHIDLVAVEAGEAEGDDIAIVADAPESPGRGGGRRALVIAAVVALAAVALAAAVALGDDDTEPEAAVGAVSDEARSGVSITRPAAPPPSAVALPEPDAVVPAPVVREPDPAAIPDPAPLTPAAVAVLEVTLDPATTTVDAGTDINVTVRVHNAGGVAGSYDYDTDACDPFLVAPADQMCTMVVRSIEVPAGGDAAHTISVHTAGAAPGVYVVPIGDRELRVTVN